MVSWVKRFFGPSSGDGAPESEGPSGKKEEGPALAFVLLQSDAFDFAHIKEKIRKSKVAGKTVSNISLNQTVLSCDVDGSFAALSLMPVPVPGNDLEGPCRTSWSRRPHPGATAPDGWLASGPLTPEAQAIFELPGRTSRCCTPSSRRRIPWNVPGRRR